MKKKILAAIVSMMFVFGASVSTSCAYDEDDWDDDEYEYVEDEDLDDVGEYLDANIYDDFDAESVEFDSNAQAILDLVNRERAEAGAAPLTLTNELMWASNIRAKELVQSFSHTRPDGSACSSLIENGMYTIGENIAAGTSTPADTMEMWMNSPGHRANILNSDYTELGVGYFYDENSEYKYYWVQMFKRPMPR